MARREAPNPVQRLPAGALFRCGHSAPESVVKSGTRVISCGRGIVSTTLFTAYWDFPRLIPWILFVLLCVLALQRSPRVAIPAIILLCNFDMSSGTAASSALGLANAVKSLFLPGLALVRFGGIRPRAIVADPLGRWWTLFCGVALIACLWSPVPLSAAKMISYLVGYLLLFGLLKRAWQQNWVEARTVFVILLCSVVIAVIQTSFAGNYFGTLEELADRFTSFSSPQSFSAFIVCCFVIVLFSDLSWLVKTIATVLSFWSVYQAGSRYCLVGAILAALIFIGKKLLESEHRLKIVVATLIIGLSGFSSIDPNGRIAELFNGDLFHNSVEDQLQLVTTFYWRLNIWGETVGRLLDRIESHDFLRVSVGSGTSSGGDVLETADPKVFSQFMDYNRAIHDEFLRIGYEWGAVGLLVFACFLASVVHSGWSELKIDNLVPVAVWPLLLLGLLIENLLAASTSPAGMGFVLALSCQLAPAHEGQCAQTAFEQEPFSPVMETPPWG
jgi:hypothetical protein